MKALSIFSVSNPNDKLLLHLYSVWGILVATVATCYGDILAIIFFSCHSQNILFNNKL